MRCVYNYLIFVFCKPHSLIIQFEPYQYFLKIFLSHEEPCLHTPEHQFLKKNPNKICSEQKKNYPQITSQKYKYYGGEVGNHF